MEKIIPDKKIFVDCEALTSVTVPSNVTMNGDSLSGQGSGNQMFYSCGNLKNAVVECSYVGPYMFEGCYALETGTFPNKDTVFYCIDKGNNLGSLTGHPFNAPGSGTMSLNIIAPECSQAHKLTVIGNTNKYINLSFTQIEQDTTVHTGGTATCKSIAVCTKCGLAYGDYSDHQYGQLVQKEDATCTAEGMEAYYQCSVCEKLFDSNRNEKTTEQLKIAAKGHDIKDVEWSSNENKHWKVCKTCSEKVDEEAHYGGEATCTEKAECDVCHEKYGELENHELNKADAKEATCTEAGNSAYWTCENCGGYFSDQNGTVEILENSWVIGIKDHDTTGAEWITDKDYHWHICKTCHQDVDKEIHDWDSGKVTKEPKAEETGVRTYSCKVCSATKDETILATGWIEGDVSDLTEDTIADSAMDGETNLVQGVDFEIGNGEVIFAPTYTDSFIGTKTVIIKVGNTVYTIAVEGTKKEEHQHSWVHKVIRNAGYLKNGLERDVCECGAYQNDRVVPGYSTSYVKSFKVKKGKGSFTAKWKKQSKANQKLFNGYQIRYSTNPSMAGAKYITAGKSSKSKKIKGLAKKARYYVQIRTYTNGFYSGWSTKSVVTK